MPFCVSSVTFVVLMSITATLRGNPLEETLLSREREFIEAIRRKDEATLKEMLTEDACTVVPGVGRQSGAQILRRLAGMAIDRYRISDVKVIEVSKDVGILSFQYSWSTRAGEERVPEGIFLSTSTWVRRGGQWKVVFYQETPWKK